MSIDPFLHPKAPTEHQCHLCGEPNLTAEEAARGMRCRRCNEAVLQKLDLDPPQCRCGGGVWAAGPGHHVHQRDDGTEAVVATEEGGIEYCPYQKPWYDEQRKKWSKPQPVGERPPLQKDLLEL